MSEKKSGNKCKKCGKTIEWNPDIINNDYPTAPCLSEGANRARSMYVEVISNSKYCSDCLSTMPAEILEKLVSIPVSIYKDFIALVRKSSKEANPTL